MNEVIGILRKLKSGKPVLIPDLTKRYSVIGMLDAFGVRTVQDGAFISLLKIESDDKT